MSTMQIDRLLETVVREDASDLHLTTGRPPTVRLNGSLKSLATKVLDNDDMTALMKSVTPEKNQQELQEVGSTDFGFAYGDKPLVFVWRSSSSGAMWRWCFGSSRTRFSPSRRSGFRRGLSRN